MTEAYDGREVVGMDLHRRLWVPKTLTPYATWAYSRIRPVPLQNVVTGLTCGFAEPFTRLGGTR
jgi:hypothetical protein